MLVMIMAGGTGGHVYPALAVAKELISTGHKVFWMGTKSGLEAKIVPQNNIEIKWISITGLRQNGILGWVFAPLNLLRAVLQALSVLRNKQPQVVLGMGGFVAGPGGVAAKLLGIPLVIHEQNAVAGLTNKILAKFANKVLQAFPGTFDKAQSVGNPVRKEIENIEKPANGNGRLKILIVGGSLGALAINEIMPKALALFVDKNLPVVWHQTGANKLKATTQDYQQNKINLADGLSELQDGGVYLTEFIQNMDEAYAWADVLICRAGAMTVFEVAASSSAALFVPYPYAVDDHQTANANYLVKAGGGKLIQQSALDPKKLYKIIKSWIDDRESLAKIALTARAKYISDSAGLVANACLEVARV